MPTISSPGIGSGLDITGIVTGLVNAEIQPKSFRLDRQEAAIQAKISALGQINGVLSSFQSSLSNLTTLSSFQSRKADVSDKDVFTATASTTASEASYQVEVLQLAKRHSVASGAYTDGTQTIGSGTINIEFGSYNLDNTVFTTNPEKSIETININSSQTSVIEIRDAINSANVGVSAAVINDTSGARLVLTSDDTGASNGLKITVIDDDGIHTDNAGLSELVFDPANGTNYFSETIKGQDAQVTINGLLLTNPSNTLDENIEGVTLNLIQEKPGTTINLDISLDDAAVKNKINNFVKNFNDLMSTIDGLTAYNSATNQGQILLGDAGTRNLRNQLTRLLSEPIDNVSTNFSTLTEIGITTNSNGLVEVDDTILSNALDNNFEEVGRLFAHGAYTSDSFIKVESIANTVDEGRYDINITTLNLGTEIVGTIGGVNASSEDGIILEAGGNYTGLSLQFLGGTTGNRGNVTVFDGIASRFDSLIDTYLGFKGSLTNRTEILTSQVSDINEEREKLSLKSARLEELYFNQFNALDTQLATLQSTSNFLTQQLSILNNIFIRENNS
jgi:flagellar hook-associated protein 2